jgi:hypothetical protein
MAWLNQNGLGKTFLNRPSEDNFGLSELEWPAILLLRAHIAHVALSLPN